MTPSRARGPGYFFADHPALFALSVASAFGTSAYAWSQASTARGGRRIGFAMLGLLTAVEGVGILGARHAARPRAPSEPSGAHTAPAAAGARHMTPGHP